MNRAAYRTEARLVFLLGLVVLVVAAAVSTAIDVRIYEIINRIAGAL